MKLQRFVGGTLESNGYVIFDVASKEAIIIDPGYNAKKFIGFVEENQLKIKAIVLTHKHHDHIGAALEVSKALDAPVWIHKFDADEYKGDNVQLLEGGETIEIGDETAEIIWTPGHTKGGISVKFPKSKWIFTGDTIFDTDLGRTDLPGGSFADMEKTMKAVVSGWENDYRIYPGHDESATMRQVRRYNSEFLEIVRNEELDFGSIKMVALDLDGTTLKDESRLSQRTKEAIALAAENDVHVVIATGRTEDSLPEDVMDLESLPFIITSNGARVFKKDGGKLEEIYQDLIEPQVMENLVEVFRDNGIHAECFVDGKAYIERCELEKIRNFQAPHRARDYVLATRTPVDDIHQFMLINKAGVENISLNYQSREEKKAAEKVLLEVDGITLTSSFPLNHEVGGRRTSKGRALQWLLSKLNVQKEALLACGDSLNDQAMIEMAKIGVAMENGAPPVKAIADYVAEPHHKDGVAKVLEKVCFEKNRKYSSTGKENFKG